MNYTIYKDYTRIDEHIFKVNDTNNIISMVRMGQLNDYLEFESYGVATYDPIDEKLQYANIETSESFNRMKTNVLIFSVRPNTYIDVLYDKLFIMKQNATTDPCTESSFHYIFHNTKTNRTTMAPCVPCEYDKLISSIMTVINRFKSYKLFKYYQQPYHKHLIKDLEVIEDEVMNIKVAHLNSNDKNIRLECDNNDENESMHINIDIIDNIDSIDNIDNFES